MQFPFLMVFCPGDRLPVRPEIQKVVHADDNTSNQDRNGLLHNIHSRRIVLNEVLAVNDVEIEESGSYDLRAQEETVHKREDMSSRAVLGVMLLINVFREDNRFLSHDLHSNVNCLA